MLESPRLQGAISVSPCAALTIAVPLRTLTIQSLTSGHKEKPFLASLPLVANSGILFALAVAAWINKDRRLEGASRSWKLNLRVYLI
jgi:hypothetical protein